MLCRVLLGVAGVQRSEPPVRSRRGLVSLDPRHPTSILWLDIALGISRRMTLGAPPPAWCGGKRGTGRCNRQIRFPRHKAGGRAMNLEVVLWAGAEVLEYDGFAPSARLVQWSAQSRSARRRPSAGAGCGGRPPREFRQVLPRGLGGRVRAAGFGGSRQKISNTSAEPTSSDVLPGRATRCGWSPARDSASLGIPR